MRFGCCTVLFTAGQAVERRVSERAKDHVDITGAFSLVIQAIVLQKQVGRASTSRYIIDLGDKP